MSDTIKELRSLQAEHGSSLKAQHGSSLESQRLDTEEETEQEENTEVEPQLVIELSNGKYAIACDLTANDYLLYIEKSLPPRQPGSSARSIGTEAASIWLIQKAYTVDDEPLTDDLMDEMELTLKDYGSLITALMAVDVEIEPLDDEDSIQSQDFKYKGKRIQRKPISWRYGTKLQKMLSQGRMQDAYADIIQRFWTIDGKAIAPQMMIKKFSEGGVGSELCKIMVEAMAELFS